MNPVILDTSLNNVAVLDTFESLIWTERYSAHGDFELYTGVDETILKNVKEDFYVWLKESEQTMIIEDLQVETDIENGNYVTITGRSLESILDRRIIWNQTILNGNFQKMQLLNLLRGKWIQLKCSSMAKIFTWEILFKLLMSLELKVNRE